MKPKIDVLRAVSSTVAKRALRLATILVVGAATIILGIIRALAYFVSDWWWLLLIVYVPLAVICTLLITSLRFFVARIYRKQLTKKQQAELNGFTDKIQRLLEARGIGWPLFAILNVKDIIFHRELRTTKNLVSDTTSLKRDFEELEKKLQS